MNNEELNYIWLFVVTGATFFYLIVRAIQAQDRWMEEHKTKKETNNDN